MNYYPYGGEVGAETGEQRAKFGTYTRDSAGVDYANQRYYSSIPGRFLTPDPSGHANLGNPGSWNQYAYVQSDPVNSVDPDGTDTITFYDWNLFNNISGSRWSFSFSNLASNPFGSEFDLRFAQFGTSRRAPAFGRGVDATRNVIYAVDNDLNFSAETMDCIGGIETGGTWDASSKAGTHRGLYPMNPDYWKSTGTKLSYDDYVKDPSVSTLVAVAGLYQKAIAVDFGGKTLVFNQYMVSHGGILTQQQIYMALQAFRGLPSGRLNQAYAEAVQECAKQMQLGNWQRARDWIYWEHQYAETYLK